MKDVNKSSQLSYYKNKSKELERKLNVYRLVTETYANPLNPYDNGELARVAIKHVSNKKFNPKRLDGCTFDMRYVEFNLDEEDHEEN